ncbi:hypothetical protein CLIB1444_01S11606 [[Candida] jaroonii]|uniref:Uncharacterized protein n=1 Tax=[Candida] jaroonii TaxID=467808 RepID=A0ACA9Y151_9ASCO|nr:hypothetical protein CLIB1444_01S11606 [[Candida] jaroonii]
MASAGFHTLSAVLILVSFVFLLLATISTPVVTSFSIGSTDNYNYGILGYCKSNAKSCPGAQYPYTLSDKDSRIDWTLTGSTRDTLAKIFILCPIAGGLNLITLVIILLSHFFSSGVLIFSIVFNLISFIVTTLVAIIVVLVFYPQVSWTGWVLIGSAAANLISLVCLFVSLRFSNNDYDDVDDNSLTEFNQLDDKFNNTTSTTTFMAPSQGFKSKYDDNSSISKDYEFKPVQNTTNSSIYNSNPQLVNDFTQHNKPSTHSFGTSNSNHTRYEDAAPNFVNGPNTPISSKQQMAPVFTPNVATPTINDVPRSNVPQVPYPSNGPLNRPTYGGNVTDMSVFEHHPEVEGHRPFTELDDDQNNDMYPIDRYPNNDYQYKRGSQGSEDIMGSDASSNFTSVSQRAPNPRYNPPPQQQYYQQDSYFPQQYDNNYPQQQAFQPHFQQQPQQQQQQPPSQPQQFYQPNQSTPVTQPMPMQQRFRSAPTASDNALANNPDFALGGMGGGRKKAPFGARQNAAKFPRRDGPYGM